LRATKRMHPRQAREIVALHWETRPSLGPSTRARQSSLCTAAQVSVVGRSRWYRGRANSRKREKPAPGLSQADEARLATVLQSSQGDVVEREEKEEGRGLRPCEDPELGFGCSHVVIQLQKSLGDV
jgi:hypothetical protein